jgi:hypothetical protein
MDEDIVPVMLDVFPHLTSSLPEAIEAVPSNEFILEVSLSLL